MTMTDTDLIYSFLEGHEASFGILMRRRRDMVYSLAYRLVGDADDAHDVTQRVFIKVFNKLHTLRNIDGFPAWLVQITRNMCLDELKSKHRKIMRRVDVMDEAVMVMSDANQAEQNSMNQLLEAALQRIPVEQREVVVMKELHQLSFAEIADVLEQPVNTVKSRLYYGLKALNMLVTTNPHFSNLRYETLS